MIERMIELLRSKDLCVLATVSGGVPHCSLMAYAPDETGRSLYMTTRQATTKFENLRENPRVSGKCACRSRTWSNGWGSVDARPFGRPALTIRPPAAPPGRRGPRTGSSARGDLP